MAAWNQCFLQFTVDEQQADLVISNLANKKAISQFMRQTLMQFHQQANQSLWNTVIVTDVDGFDPHWYRSFPV